MSSASRRSMEEHAAACEACAAALRDARRALDAVTPHIDIALPEGVETAIEGDTLVLSVVPAPVAVLETEGEGDAAEAEAEAADILAPYQPCFITSVPDEKWGEKVVLAVLRAVPESLLHGLRARLGSVRAPKEIRVIDRIPLSPSGKPLRPKLPK